MHMSHRTHTEAIYRCGGKALLAARSGHTMTITATTVVVLILDGINRTRKDDTMTNVTAPAYLMPT